MVYLNCTRKQEQCFYPNNDVRRKYIDTNALNQVQLTSFHLSCLFQYFVLASILSYRFEIILTQIQIFLCLWEKITCTYNMIFLEEYEYCNFFIWYYRIIYVGNCSSIIKNKGTISSCENRVAEIIIMTWYTKA